MLCSTRDKKSTNRNGKLGRRGRVGGKVTTGPDQNTLKRRKAAGLNVRSRKKYGAVRKTW